MNKKLVQISIEKDPARHGYKIGIDLNIDALEIEMGDPGDTFVKMLNKEFKNIILEIQKMASDHDRFIEGAYYRVCIPEYYECPKCGQWINENDRKRHEKRWFDYSVCPQPGGIIHIRRKDEQVPKVRMESKKKEPDKGKGDLATHLLSTGSEEKK